MNTYYIDTAGQNTNDGLSPETAFADFSVINTVLPA